MMVEAMTWAAIRERLEVAEDVDEQVQVIAVIGAAEPSDEVRERAGKFALSGAYLDAIVAVVEAEGLDWGADGKEGLLCREYDATVHDQLGQAPTPALALCLAYARFKEATDDNT